MFHLSIVAIPHFSSFICWNKPHRTNWLTSWKWLSLKFLKFAADIVPILLEKDFQFELFQCWVQQCQEDGREGKFERALGWLSNTLRLCRVTGSSESSVIQVTKALLTPNTINSGQNIQKGYRVLEYSTYYRRNNRCYDFSDIICFCCRAAVCR